MKNLNDGSFKEGLTHDMRIKKLFNALHYGLALLVLLNLISCRVDNEEQVETLNENLEEFEKLRELVESRYRRIFQDTAYNRTRVVFINCDENDVLNEQDYFCDDKVVLQAMEALGLRKIAFEKSGIPCSPRSIFNEIHCQIKKTSHYPVVTYVYEYCGSRPTYESKTIFYQPVRSNWSVLVDSNFP